MDWELYEERWLGAPAWSAAHCTGVSAQCLRAPPLSHPSPTPVTCRVFVENPHPAPPFRGQDHCTGGSTCAPIAPPVLLPPYIQRACGTVRPAADQPRVPTTNLDQNPLSGPCSQRPSLNALPTLSSQADQIAMSLDDIIKTQKKTGGGGEGRGRGGRGGDTGETLFYCFLWGWGRSRADSPPSAMFFCPFLGTGKRPCSNFVRRHRRQFFAVLPARVSQPHH